MPDTGGERTERATPKRREEARKKGNVARSVEVNSAMVLFTGTVVLGLMANSFLVNIQGFMREIFGHVMNYAITAENMRAYSLDLFILILRIIGPVLLSVLVVGIAANVMQVGFLLTGESIKPELQKLDPVAGFRRLFSARSVAELVKGLIKIVIVGLVIYVTIQGAVREFIPLMDKSLGQMMAFLGATMLKISIRASVALIVLAAMDYAFQRWQYERDLRMTKQEIKEEFKEHEGDPLVKSRIRGLQREMARSRMMAEVPKADVVITNPTHYAVALRYRPEEMNAPILVAKGARKVALKIRQAAEEHGVPIVEDPPLARELYRSCEINQEVPVELYKSVAEILAYVYQLKEQRRSRA